MLSPLSAWQRALLTSLPLSTLLLLVQAIAPLRGETSAAAWLNWLLLGTTICGLLAILYRGERLEQVAGGTVLFAIAQVLFLARGFQGSTSLHDGSALAGGLSTTYGGLPLHALGAAWSVLGLGWLAQRAFVRSFPHRGEVAAGVGTGLGILVAAFGLRAVIGYASGSTTLFAN